MAIVNKKFQLSAFSDYQQVTREEAQSMNAFIPLFEPGKGNYKLSLSEISDDYVETVVINLDEFGTDYVPEVTTKLPEDLNTPSMDNWIYFETESNEPLIKGLSLNHEVVDVVTSNDSSLANRIINGYNDKKQVFIKVRIPYRDKGYSDITKNLNYVTFELTNAVKTNVLDKDYYTFQFSCENYTNTAILGSFDVWKEKYGNNIGFIQIECTKNGDTIESFKMLGDYIKIYKPAVNNFYLDPSDPYTVQLPISKNRETPEFNGPLFFSNGSKPSIIINTESQNILDDTYNGISIMGGSSNQLYIKNSTVANFPVYNKNTVTAYHTAGKTSFHANLTTFNLLCCKNQNRPGKGYQQKSEKSSVFTDNPVYGGSSVFINSTLAENQIITTLDIEINEDGSASFNDSDVYTWHLGCLGYDPNYENGDYVHVELDGTDAYHFNNRYFTKDTLVLSATGMCQLLLKPPALESNLYVVLRVKGEGQALQAVRSNYIAENYNALIEKPGAIYFDPFIVHRNTSSPLNNFEFTMVGNIRIVLLTPLSALHGNAWGNTHS